MFLEDAFDQRMITKIKNHFSQDAWNLLDVLIFIIFYSGVFLKYYVRLFKIIQQLFKIINNTNSVFVNIQPTISDVCLAWNESCIEIGRVCYTIAMIMSYLKTLRYLKVLPEWGPKLYLLKELVIFIKIIYDQTIFEKFPDSSFIFGLSLIIFYKNFPDFVCH